MNIKKELGALNVTTEELFSNNHLKDVDKLIVEINDILDFVKNDKRKLERIYKIVKYLSEE